jgi:hypothetical protein
MDEQRSTRVPDNATRSTAQPSGRPATSAFGAPQSEPSQGSVDLPKQQPDATTDKYVPPSPAPVPAAPVPQVFKT